MTDEKNAQPDGLPRGVKKVARGWEIELDYPIFRTGQQIKTVTMRRPNVGHIEVLAREAEGETDDTGLVAMNNMLGELLGFAADEIREVDAEDWLRMLEVIKPHLEKLQRGRPI